MQITKSHLKRIILEELQHFDEGAFPHPSGDPALTMVGAKGSPADPDETELAISLLKAIMTEYRSAGEISPDTLGSIEAFISDAEPERFTTPSDGQSEVVPPTDGEVEA